MSKLKDGYFFGLSEYFYQISKSEAEIEQIRLTLSSLQEFESFYLFKILDKGPKSKISALDLQDFLQKLSFPCNTPELEGLIHQYDSDRDGFLSLSEFQNLVLPSTSKILRDLASFRSMPKLTPLFIKTFGKLLKLEITLYRKSRFFKEKFALSTSFTPILAFEALRFNRNGFLDRWNIIQILNKTAHVVNDELVDCFFRRVDEDGDGVICFREFEELFRIYDFQPGIVKDLESYRKKHIWGYKRFYSSR